MRIEDLNYIIEIEETEDEAALLNVTRLALERAVSNLVSEESIEQFCSRENSWLSNLPKIK